MRINHVLRGKVPSCDVVGCSLRREQMALQVGRGNGEGLAVEHCLVQQRWLAAAGSLGKRGTSECMGGCHNQRKRARL